MHFFQADILDVPVVLPRHTETTALGAALLAGLSTGFWEGLSVLEGLNPPDHVYEPKMPQHQRDHLLDGWHRAVDTVRSHGSG